MVRLLVPFVLLQFLPVPALAQAPDCAEAVTQVDLNACTHAEWQAADADLNAAYGAAMAQMKAIDAAYPEAERGAVAALRQAQRNWIAFRDAACEAEAWTVRGGSMEPMVRFGCLGRLTAARSMDLQALQGN